MTTLPISLREEDLLLDSLPYTLDELHKAFSISVGACGLISYKLRILCLQYNVEAIASVPIEAEDLGTQ